MVPEPTDEMNLYRIGNRQVLQTGSLLQHLTGNHHLRLTVNLRLLHRIDNHHPLQHLTGNLQVFPQRQGLVPVPVRLEVEAVP
jgi:hypothetical protein